MSANSSENRQTRNVWASGLLLTKRAWICCLLLAAVTGCQRTLPAEPTSLEDGLRAITVALDAWRERKTTEDLRNGPEQMIVRDEDWEQGKPLRDYRLMEDANVFGNYVRVPVELNLVDSRGNSRKQMARYMVSLHPVQIISRDDSFD